MSKNSLEIDIPIETRTLSQLIEKGEYPLQDLDVTDSETAQAFLAKWLRLCFNVNSTTDQSMKDVCNRKILQAEENRGELFKLLEREVDYWDQKIRYEKEGGDYIRKLRACMKFLQD